MPEEEFTTIRIKTKTRDRLRLRGQMGDNFDEVIEKLLDETKG